MQVDQITEVRMALSRGESMRSIAKRCRISRNTVRKISCSGQTEFRYKAREPSYPALGAYRERLEQMLAAEEDLPCGKRRTMLQIFGAIQSEGYRGGYDAIRRYGKSWKDKCKPVSKAFVPLVFGKGEAFQFDWSEELVELCGVPVKVYVAHFRLCHSRMRFCIAFMRMSLEMLFAAHIAAHDFFGGFCGIGIYDNPRTVVSRIGKGKDREYNKRFKQLASHYLFEPRACTPASGWEKGQVENQVKVLRQRVFTPRLRFSSLEELNAHLAEQMLQEAHNQRHPEFTAKSVWQVYEEEREYLRTQAQAFDGYVGDERRASSECLVQYDRNFYSLPCAYAGRAVAVRAYAGHVVLAVDGKTVAQHRREFDKGHYVLDVMHYVPLLPRKPGALRNGRPFLEWNPPAPIRAVWDRLKHFPDWDRQMASILASIPTYGLEAVSVACETALEQGVVSQTVIMNYLGRLTEDSSPAPAREPEKLVLSLPPLADCLRYDRLLGGYACCASKS